MEGMEEGGESAAGKMTGRRLHRRHAARGEEIGLIGTFGPRLVTYLLNWRAGRLAGWSGCVGG